MSTTWTPKHSAVPISYVMSGSGKSGLKRHWFINWYGRERPACGELLSNSKAAYEGTPLCDSCKVLMLDLADRLREAAQ